MKAQMKKLAQSSAIILAAIGAFAPLALPAPAFADKAPVFTGLASNAAIRGYDTVAYFTTGRPTRGDARYSTNWHGATWHFASAANRDRFAANPARYAPQFGGYCAWAVSQGYTAGIDPNAWRIVDGKLYLNYNREIQARWEQNTAANIAAGNRNWPSVLRD
jgi:YHS domain-containing protein